MLRKLFSQTAIYGTSMVISKFLNYLLTPYLTRVLGTDVFGDVSMYFAMIPFANTLLTMGLATGYFRFAAKCASQEEKRELFSTLWTAVSVLSILFFVILSSISDVVNYTEVRWYMVVTAALIMVDNICAMPFAAIREQGRPRYYMMVNVINVLVNIGVCLALYTFIPGATSHAGWVIVANLVASTVSLILLLPAAMKLYVRKFSIKVLKTVSVYSIPLMIAGLMGTASDFIDRQMLDIFLPEDGARSGVGIYSAVSKIAALMMIFRSIYTMGAEPFFLQNFSKDDFKKLNAEAMKYYIIAGLMIFLGITLFEDLFGRIIGKDFRSGMIVVPVLLMANLLSGIQVNLSFWYKQVEKTNIAIYVTLIGFVLTVVLNYVLIPTYGYEGSAWTRLTATLAMVLVSYILGRIYYKIPYDLKRISIYFLAAMGIYALSLYTVTLDPIAQYSVNILLILCYALLAYKLEWKKLKS